MDAILILFIGGFLYMCLMMFFFIRRYIKCPPDKILVIYGKISQDPNEKYKIVTSGAQFVWPVIQEFEFMDALPFEVNVRNEIKLGDGQRLLIKTDLMCRIAKDENLTIKAVELFYQKQQNEIKELVRDRLKTTIDRYASKHREEIIPNVTESKIKIEDLVSNDLNKLGLDLVAIKNVEVK